MERKNKLNSLIISAIDDVKTELKEEVITESSLSRIWQHIESNESFGVISPFRRDLSLDENNLRFSELKDIVRSKLGLGFIEMKGGFKEEGSWVKERSLFIPNINKKDLFNLGVKYEQYSVIYKDNNEFIEIGTNEFAGVGSIKTNFIKQGFGKNISINSGQTKELFSQLLKGSHRGDKFLFNLKESYLYEVVPFSFNELAYNKNKTQKLIKLI